MPLSQAPRQLPPFPLLVDDLGTPDSVARALRVSPRTVRRWLTAGGAPHAAVLALFWLSRWGRSQLDADMHNAAASHAGMARCLAEEVTRLRAELAHVLAIADTGAANSPSLSVAPLAPVIPLRRA